jgi:hypothetical protein
MKRRSTAELERRFNPYDAVRALSHYRKPTATVRRDCDDKRI